MTRRSSADPELVLANVSARRVGAIGELELTRYAQRNAINEEMGEEILQACQWLDGQRHLKTVVVYGRGQMFCAGMDLELLRRGTPAQLRSVVDMTTRFVERMAGMKAILIGAIEGACVGTTGVMLAAGCDLRYAARDTRFLLPEASLGLPVMQNGLKFLAQELSTSQALAASLLEKPISAQSLHDSAFLNGICEPGETAARARAVAVQLAQKPGLVLQKNKQHIAAAKHELIRATAQRQQQFVDDIQTVLTNPKMLGIRTARLQESDLQRNF